MMDEQRSREPTMAERLNAILAWAQAIAMPVELFLRKPGTAGCRYFSGRVFIGIFLMVAIIALVGGEGRGFPQQRYDGPNWFNYTPPYEPPPPSFQTGKYDGLVIGVAFWGSLFMFAVHKAKERKLEKGGMGSAHSQYTGESWLGPDDWSSKLRKEPALVFCLGMVSLVLSLGLGVYLVVAAFCLGLVSGNQKLETVARQRAMRDAMVEQQSFLEDFR